MSTTELGEPLKLGRGCIMRFKTTAAEPPASPFHRYSETTCDGAADSYHPRVPAHWHAHHDEYMEVVEGCVRFVLEGRAVVLRGGDARLHLPRRKVHGFAFEKGTRTVLREYTDPVGEYKEAFFRDMAQCATDDGLSFLMAIRAFHQGDAYVALPGGFKALDRAVTGILGTVASFFVPVKPKVVEMPGEVK